MSGNWDKVVLFYSVLLSFSLLAFTRRRGPGIVYFPGPDELAERKGEKREEGKKKQQASQMMRIVVEKRGSWTTFV